MLTGVYALLERSLRLDARDRWAHGLRLIAILIGFCAMLNAANAGTFLGAPGLLYFQMMITLNSLLIAAAGISYFSTTITEEKEEGTLGLMRMTGLSGLGILLGKFGGRLVQALLLIVTQLPFTLLGVTLGGVTLAQVQAMTLALVTLMFFSANAALLVSVLSRTSRQAAFRMTLVVVVYCLSAWVAHEVFRVVAMWPSPTLPGLSSLAALPRLFVFRRIEECLLSGTLPKLFTLHEWFNVLGGLTAFGLAWLAFAWGAIPAEDEPESPGWFGRRTGRWSRFRPGRVWNSALFWKEFHFLLGGWPWLLLKFAGYAAFVAGVWCYWHLWEKGWNRSWSARDIGIEVASVFLWLLLAWDAALIASRMFQEEIRGKTWSTLAAMPVSFTETCYTKVAAGLVGLCPLLVVQLSLVCGTSTGARVATENLDEVMLWGIVAMFITIVHIAALLSLYLRWGAVPLAVAAVWVPFFLFVMLIQPGPGNTEDAMGGMMIGGSFVACFICHALVGQRLRELAAES